MPPRGCLDLVGRINRPKLHSIRLTMAKDLLSLLDKLPAVDLLSARDWLAQHLAFREALLAPTCSRSAIHRYDTLGEDARCAFCGKTKQETSLEPVPKWHPVDTP